MDLKKYFSGQLKFNQKNCGINLTFLVKNVQKKPRKPKFSRVILEATIGFEPMIRVLQTRALPLGYVAIMTPTGIEPVLPP